MVPADKSVSIKPCLIAIPSKDSVWVCSWVQSTPPPPHTHTHTHMRTRTHREFPVWPYKEGTSCWLPWWLRELKTVPCWCEAAAAGTVACVFPGTAGVAVEPPAAAAPGRSGAGGPTVCVQGADAAGVCGWDATAGTRPPGLGTQHMALGYTADSSTQPWTN